MFKSKILTKTLATLLTFASVATIGLAIPTKDVSAATVPKYASVVVDIALNEVGYREKASNSRLNEKYANPGSGEDNYNKYAEYFDAKRPAYKFYNGVKNHYAAWCDIFVDWCFVQAYTYHLGQQMIYQSSNSAGAGCYYSYSYYKNKPSSPQVGDQIFFKQNGLWDKDHGHTGLVVEVKNGYVYTVEGNSNDRVERKSYSLRDSRIVGYGRPDYNSAPSASTFVANLYTSCLGRPGSEYEVSSWSSELKNHRTSAADVVLGFFGSKEFRDKNLSDNEFIRRAYKALFDREPDESGKNFWLTQLKHGAPRLELLKDMMKAQEFVDKCNQNGIIRGQL